MSVLIESETGPSSKQKYDADFDVDQPTPGESDPDEAKVCKYTCMGPSYVF